MSDNSETPQAMLLSRVLVVGAGALGGVYGAAFARAGCDVQLLAREPHARAIQEQGGLQVRSFAGDLFVELRANWRGREIEPVDLVVLMAKTPDTEVALRDLSHVRDGVTVAVSWQNGLTKDGALGAWCGRDRVIGGASMVGALAGEPGTVHHTFTGPTFVGEIPTGTSARTLTIARLLELGGLPAIDTNDIASVEWSKVVQVLPAMSLTALTRMRYHEVLTSPDLSRLFARLVRETVQVAAADGVTVADWPAMLPVATLAALPEDEAAATVRAFGQTLVDAGQTNIKPSMLQSVERGRHLEVEAIQGHVAREAARLGVDAPTVKVCYELLHGIDQSLA